MVSKSDYLFIYIMKQRYNCSYILEIVRVSLLKYPLWFRGGVLQMVDHCECIRLQYTKTVIVAVLDHNPLHTFH